MDTIGKLSGLLLGCALLSGFSFDTTPDASPEWHQLVVEPRITYEQFKMPEDIPPMGITGIHMLLDLFPSFYAGLGLYGALNGDSGGFFALALEGGLQYEIWHKFIIDGGARVGGGGGGGAPVGGGLFIEPYAGLKYDFGSFRAGAYYSYVNFVYGDIKSQQVGAEINFPFTLDYATAHYLSPRTRFSDLQFPSLQRLGERQYYFAGMTRAYFPLSHIRSISGAPLGTAIEFLGFEVGYYLLDELFLFFNFNGALHGEQNGYADELLGLGYRYAMKSIPLDLQLKLGLGSGGGGGVNTSGGFIFEPTIGLEYHLNSILGIEINGGVVFSDGETFQATETSFLLKYYLSNAILSSTRDKADELEPVPGFQPWRARLLHQTYFNPRNELGETAPNVQLFGPQFDFFFMRYLYVTGQSVFAYQGQASGGYFTGLLGFGVQTPAMFNHRVSLFAEIMAGAADGSSFDMEQGAVYEPVIGLNFHVNHALGLQASVGRLAAFRGDFHPVTFNAGLFYKFWSIK